MTAEYAHRDELDLLLGALCDDRLDAAEGDRLIELLTANEAAQWRYVEYLCIHANMIWDETYSASRSRAIAAALQPPQILERGAAEKRNLFRLRARSVSFSLATLLLTILSGAALLVHSRQLAEFGSEIPAPRANPAAKGSSRGPIAWIGAFCYPAFEEGTSVYIAQQGLLEGDSFHLRSGAIDIRFRRGTRLLLEGPCRLTIVDEDQVKLERGSLMVSAPRGASGFEIAAPNAVVRNAGEEFFIHVDDAGRASFYQALRLDYVGRSFILSATVTRIAHGDAPGNSSPSAPRDGAEAPEYDYDVGLYRGHLLWGEMWRIHGEHAPPTPMKASKETHVQLPLDASALALAPGEAALVGFRVRSDGAPLHFDNVKPLRTDETF